MQNTNYVLLLDVELFKKTVYYLRRYSPGSRYSVPKDSESWATHCPLSLNLEALSYLAWVSNVDETMTQNSQTGCYFAYSGGPGNA